MQELRDLKEKLLAEKATITDQSGPLREERDALIAKMAPMEARARELAQQIAEIERPRLAEIDNQVSKLSIALGGKKFSG